MKIPFNKPYITGVEAENISEAISRGQLSSNGYFSSLCAKWCEQHLAFGRALPTSSCTAALEIAALLCEIDVGDEVIMPSFTFVSTALAFAKFGAKIRFVDSLPEHPNMDCSVLENAITPRTKAIVAVHYNGVSCSMELIMNLAAKHNLMVIEDAAHAINSIECGKRGDVACYSFHETKNIHCGEGGLLGINNLELVARAQKLWLKGTNRLDFEKQITSKYEWVDMGGSYAMSELSAAFLWGQMTEFQSIINRRHAQWCRYFNNLNSCGLELPSEQGSSHIFYLVCANEKHRNSLLAHLSKQNILAPFHYQSLHKSPFGKQFFYEGELPNADRFSHCLLRLPLFYELTDVQIDNISKHIQQWIAITL